MLSTCCPLIVSTDCSAAPYTLIRGCFATAYQVPGDCWAGSFGESSHQLKAMFAVMTRPLYTTLRPKYYRGLLEEDSNTLSQMCTVLPSLP